MLCSAVGVVSPAVRHIVVMIMIVLMFYVKSVADPPVNYWLLLHSFDLNMSQKCGEHYNMNTVYTVILFLI